MLTNAGDAGYSNSYKWGGSTATFDGTNDNKAMNIQVVAGFKASDTMNLEAGYGSSTNEQDVSGAEADDISCVYAQANITLADGFFIVPEIGMVDFGQDNTGTEEGTVTYFGAKWQMNF